MRSMTIELSTVLALMGVGTACTTVLSEANSDTVAEQEGESDDEIGSEAETTDETSTSTESETETESDSESESESDSDSETGSELCAGPCGTPNCGDCPDTEMVMGMTADTEMTMGGPFLIDATETTIAEYGAFVGLELDDMLLSDVCSWKDGALWQEPEFWDVPAPDGQLTKPDDLPVVWVDWCDAQAYCTWAGKRLCGSQSEEPAGFDDLKASGSEWYQACSDADTNNFPYGAAFNAETCNGWKEDPALVPVGSLSDCEGSLDGLHDMSGNVWEWVDLCETGEFEEDDDECRQRGGAWNSQATYLSCDANGRGARDFRGSDVGIRCCASL